MEKLKQQAYICSMQMQTKKAENVQGTNAAQTEKKVANIISTLIEREQHFIYRMQSSKETKLDAKKAKQYRQKMRRILENFYFKICIQKDGEKRKTAITEFIAHYKAHYILNDFSLNSITSGRSEEKRESYAQMLKIVQQSISK